MFVIYIVKGIGVDVAVEPGAAEPLKLLPYLLVLVLALAGMDVLLILSLGIFVNLIIGLVTGSLGWVEWLSSVGEGIGGMGSLIIVTLLAGGMMTLIRAGGGLEWIVTSLTRRLAPSSSTASGLASSSQVSSVEASPVTSGDSSPVTSGDSSPVTSGDSSSVTSSDSSPVIPGGISPVIPSEAKESFTRRQRRGAELSIAALVSLANLCTANNTIAIITVGGIAKDVADRFGLDRRRVASILDTFSCFVQGLIPYGAQLLMASGLAGIGAATIIRYLYYPFALGLVAFAAILLPSRKRV